MGSGKKLKPPRRERTWVKHGHKRLYLLALGGVILVLVIAWSLSAPSPGRAAPDFILNDSKGQEFQLTSVLAQKPVVVNFISSLNCRSCTSELPKYQQLWSTYQNRISMIWISLNPAETDADLNQFSQEKNSPWTWARDVSGVAQKFGVASFPTLFLVDKSGNIRHEAGELDLAAVSSLLNGLVS